MEPSMIPLAIPLAIALAFVARFAVPRVRLPPRVGFLAAGLALASGLGWPALLLLGFALSFSSTVLAVKVMKNRAFAGRMVAIGKYPEEVERLRQLGADAVFPIYDEAGSAFADDAWAGRSQQPNPVLNPVHNPAQPPSLAPTTP